MVFRGIKFGRVIDGDAKCKALRVCVRNVRGVIAIEGYPPRTAREWLRRQFTYFFKQAVKKTLIGARELPRNSLAVDLEL
jgi:hypothetical protein